MPGSPPTMSPRPPENLIAGTPVEPPARLSDRARGWAKRGLFALGLALLSAWLFGAWLFIRADGHMYWHVPGREEHPNSEHNMALHTYGPRIRASSYLRDVASSHHPAFVLDGVLAPSEQERWRSHPRDRRPWLEVTWKEARRLSRVVLRHEGPPAIAHRVTCLTAPGARPVVLEVAAGGAAVAQHALACNAARSVRVDWRLSAKDDSVSLYELEAWGR
jgi:hypothetical protein